MDIYKVKRRAKWTAIIGMLVLTGMAMVCRPPQPPKVLPIEQTAIVIVYTPTSVPASPTDTATPESIFIFPTQEVHTPVENPTEVPGNTPTVLVVPQASPKPAPVQIPKGT